MATFPTAKIHRVNRTRLGRGQSVKLPFVTATVQTLGTIATLTFSRPVVVSASLNIHPVGLSLVSQQQVSSTVWRLTYSGRVDLVAYGGIPAGYAGVSSAQGGQFAGIPAFEFGPPNPSVVLAWYAADEIVGLSDGDPVDTWADLSSQGNDLIGSGAGRPIFMTNQLNGLPGVSFTPSQRLACSPSTALPVPYSVVAVVDGINAGTNQFVWQTEATGHGALKTNSGYAQLVSGGGILLSSPLSSSPHVVGGFYGSATVYMSIDRAIVAGPVSDTNSTGGVVLVGSTHVPNLYLTGKVFELIVAPGDMIAAITGYLLAKWNL